MRIHDILQNIVNYRMARNIHDVESLAKPWMPKNKFYLYPLCIFPSEHQRKTLRIFIIDGQPTNLRILPYFKNTDYYFSLVTCQVNKKHFADFRELLQKVNPLFDRRRITVLCNEEEQIALAQDEGFTAIFCNHNCWLDENVFKITNATEERKYNIVLNTRPEKWKRAYLANQIEKRAIIKGNISRPKEVYDLSSLNPDYLNQKRLTPLEVCGIYNQSRCGGIFSEVEGACYSSSEYLLCGLPVISTKSKGGRDIWYDDENSIICADNEASVLECFHVLEQKLAAGQIVRDRIRQRHIEKMLYFRNNFVNYLQALLDKQRIKINAHEIMQAKFVHKLHEKHTLAESIALLSK